MQANIFIKDVKTEGNKITGIQFYDDWTIDLGNGDSSQIVIGDGIEFKVDTADEMLSKKSNVYATITYPADEIMYDIIVIRGTISDNKFIMSNQNPIINASKLGNISYTNISADRPMLILVFNGYGKFFNGYILTEGAKSIK